MADGHAALADTLRGLHADAHRLLDLINSLLASADTGVTPGDADYLPKPFNPVFLRARIGASLEKKRLRDLDERQAAELAEWKGTLEQRVAEKVREVGQLGRLKRFFSRVPRAPRLHRVHGNGRARGPDGRAPEYHGAMGQLILESEGTLDLHRRRHDGLLQRSRPRPEPGRKRRADGRRDAIARDRSRDYAAIGTVTNLSAPPSTSRGY